MSTLRTTTLKHGGSTILDNLVLSNAGETRFCPNSSFGRAALYVDGQTNRVGVNTESPGVALDVDGAINATGNVTFGGTLTVTGTVIFNGNINADGRFLTIGGMQVTSNLTPTTGAGWELFRSSGGFAQMQAYDRSGSQLLQARITSARWRINEAGSIGVSATDADLSGIVGGRIEAYGSNNRLLLSPSVTTGTIESLSFNYDATNDLGVISARTGGLVFTTSTGSAATTRLTIDTTGVVLVGRETVSKSTFGGTAQYSLFKVQGDTISSTSGVGSVNLARGQVANDFGGSFAAGVLVGSDKDGREFSSIVFAADGTPNNTSTGGKILFNVTPTGSTNASTLAMTINRNGQVGIGATPQQRLHVRDDASEYPLLVQSRINATSNCGIALIATGSDFGDGQYAAVRANSGPTGNTSHGLQFLTCQSGQDPTVYFSLSEVGKVDFISRGDGVAFKHVVTQDPDNAAVKKAIKSYGKIIDRGTTERNIDIVQSIDNGTNINVLIQGEFATNSATTSETGKITFEAGFHRSPGGNFTFWVGTPVVTRFRGTSLGAGSLAWVGGDANVKILRYTTNANAFYTSYFMKDLTITGNDYAPVTVL